MSNKLEQIQSLFRQLWGQVEKLLKEDEPVTRALSMHDIFGKVWGKVEERYPMAYLHDIFADADGSLFAILSQDGKLYRSPITIQDNLIDLGEWVEVVQEFRPIAERTRTQIVRQADGRVRWFWTCSNFLLNLPSFMAGKQKKGADSKFRVCARCVYVSLSYPTGGFPAGWLFGFLLDSKSLKWWPWPQPTRLGGAVNVGHTLST